MNKNKAFLLATVTFCVGLVLLSSWYAFAVTYLQIDSSGTIVPPAPQADLTYSGGPVDWGQIEQGGQKTKTFSVTNDGDAVTGTLTVTVSPLPSGVSVLSYEIVTNPLPVGESTDISVTLVAEETAVLGDFFGATITVADEV